MTDAERRRIYLMRHAQVRYFQAVHPHDVQLTDAGRRQAQAAADALRAIRFDRVITSGLPRATETARIVAPNDEPEPNPALREIESGDIRGLDASVVQEMMTAAFRGVVPLETRFLGGETIGELLDRVLPELDALLADARWDVCLLVLHGAVNRAILSRAVTAVRGLSLSVDRGEIVGLIGPNGAGKSSTLNAIMGAVPPAAGEVRLHGRSIVGRPPEDVARAGVALVPEGRRIFGELTVEENLRLGLSGRRSRRDLAEDLERVFDLFPVVKEFRRRQAGALSGGQQQQLAIARALVADPQVLLLDEPSLGLAPAAVDAVFEALTKIRERGVTILLVEQRAQRTVALADRTHVLVGAELRMTLGPADAENTAKIVAAYLSS